MARPAVYLVAAAVVAIDGLNWPIMARGVELVPPLWLATFRLAGAAILAGSIMAARGRIRRPTRDDRPILLSVGLGRLAFVTAATFVALRIVPPGRSSILAYTASLWTAPMAIIVLHERLTRLRLIGLGLGCAGIVFILEPWSLDPTDADTLVGFGLLIGSAVATAATAVHIRAHRWTRSSLELMPWQLAVAAVPLAVLALALEGSPSVPWSAPTAAIVGYQIVFSSVIALWGALTFIRSVPAITSNLTLMAVPVIGLSSSVLLVNDPVSGSLILGLVLVLGGVGLGLWSDHRPDAPPLPSP
jgi:drug/metabolite transporter (DMT)-like permease